MCVYTYTRFRMRHNNILGGCCGLTLRCSRRRDNRWRCRLRHMCGDFNKGCPSTRIGKTTVMSHDAFDMLKTVLAILFFSLEIVYNRKWWWNNVKDGKMELENRERVKVSTRMRRECHRVQVRTRNILKIRHSIGYVQIQSTDGWCYVPWHGHYKMLVVFGKSKHRTLSSRLPLLLLLPLLIILSSMLDLHITYICYVCVFVFVCNVLCAHVHNVDGDALHFYSAQNHRKYIDYVVCCERYRIEDFQWNKHSWLLLCNNTWHVNI